jgi:hypothetical protein
MSLYNGTKVIYANIIVNYELYVTFIIYYYHSHKALTIRVMHLPT